MENEKAIAEINEVIAQVEAKLTPGCEIGARDKATIKGLLKLHNIDRNMMFFPCQRENSARIVHHFVKIKGIPQSRFSINAQPGIFLLYGAEVEGTPKETKPRHEMREQKESKKEREEVTGSLAGAHKEVKVPKEVKPEKEAKPQKQPAARKDTAAGKPKPAKGVKSQAKTQKAAKGKAGTKKAKGRGK